MKISHLSGLLLAIILVPACFGAETLTETTAKSKKATTNVKTTKQTKAKKFKKTTTKKAPVKKSAAKKTSKKAVSKEPTAKKAPIKKKSVVKTAGSYTPAGAVAEQTAVSKQLTLIKPQKQSLIIYTLTKDQIGQPFAITLWEKGGAQWKLYRRPEGIKFFGIKRGQITTRGASHKWIIAGIASGKYELVFYKTKPLGFFKKLTEVQPKSRMRKYLIVVP